MTKKILFIFKKGRKIDNLQNITSSEFFYGLISLKNFGVEADFIEENCIGIGDINNKYYTFLNKVFTKIFSIPIISIFLLYLSRKKLNKSKVIVLTTNTQGILFSIAKKLKIIKSEIYYIIMGSVKYDSSKLSIYIYSKLFSETNLIFQSENELDFVQKKIPKLNKFFVPFGVNHNFWTNDLSSNENKNNYILSIGNDLSRDHQSLIDCWKINYPELIIITSLKVKNNKPNVKILKGDWKTKIYSDYEIREFYRNSLFVIVALKPNIDASGQSVVLQAMSCAKPVILTKTIGFWDKNHFIENQNIIFVKENNHNDLNAKVEKLIHNKNLRNILSINSRKLIEDYFNEEIMGNKLIEIFKNENIN